MLRQSLLVVVAGRQASGGGHLPRFGAGSIPASAPSISRACQAFQSAGPFVFSAIRKSCPQFAHFVGVTLAPRRLRMYCSVMPTVVCPSCSLVSRILPVDSSLSVAAFAARSGRTDPARPGDSGRAPCAKNRSLIPPPAGFRRLKDGDGDLVSVCSCWCWCNFDPRGGGRYGIENCLVDLKAMPPCRRSAKSSGVGQRPPLVRGAGQSGSPPIAVPGACNRSTCRPWWLPRGRDR